MAIALAGFLMVLLVKFPGTKNLKAAGKLEPALLNQEHCRWLYDVAFRAYLWRFDVVHNALCKGIQRGQAGIFFSVFAVGIAVAPCFGRIFDRKGPSC
jgi:hypothetical protein